MLRAAGLRVELVGRTARDGVHAFEALDGLLPGADYLVLAAPLTDQTRGLLNARHARPGCADTARVVNVGRGAADRAGRPGRRRCRRRRIAGAALDVFEVEPLPDGLAAVDA